MSVNEKMTAIADAIRAKTGGTEPLGLDAMAQAIAGISGGPESIDKIDGGVFTMTSTHSSGKYDIPHNLGVYPDVYLVYNIQATASTAPTNRSMKFYLVCYGRHKLSSTTYDGVYALCGTDYSTASQIAVSTISNYCDNLELHVNYAYYATLVSGQTYAWTAFTFKR